ncbi:MAG: BON domain-containing protein [Flavobacterium sp.]
MNIKENNGEEKKDIEITTEILTIFSWNWNTLNDTIKVKVTKGWVTLSGKVEWNYQKEAAKAEVTNLIGVKGVCNNIRIQSQEGIKINKLALDLALQNHLALDSKNIKIEILGSTIILIGTIDSWEQKGIAERIAWKTPGVINIDNKLRMEEE